MLLIPAEDRQARSQVAPDRVLLRCDDKGCTLSASNCERRFPDLQTALDSARRSLDTEAATIEIWQSGQYICCMAPRSWQRSAGDLPKGAGPRLVPNSTLIAAERHANRAAQVLMATAGPLFWVALVVVVAAASLGWRLLFL